VRAAAISQLTAAPHLAMDARANRLEAESPAPAFPSPLSPMPGLLSFWWGAPAAVSREPSPDLTLPLAQPITLAHGPRSHLVTLMDAAILIRDLESFRRGRCGTGRPR